ncbi:hypothetical protein ETB97_001429 [Aspergillus alliaceus]|uniref:LPS glycosyltransferase n=1 Tax=Petromyces alliaceus TaxID=209559 RepID=A0A8H6A3W5_PETAA|nr:hypothetical protein ETB97_001429 [Aspergillus burnettii]
MLVQYGIKACQQYKHWLVASAVLACLLFYASNVILTARMSTVSERAGNSTLGFERIFYISLPQRTDRQDAMSLVAAVSGLSLTLEHGVNGSLMSSKARPEYSESLRPEQLGSWRGHANTWKRIIDEKVETALIMEDDGDWDVNVRDISKELSRQLSRQSLFSELMPTKSPKIAPYGPGWDVLYLGTCWDIPNIDTRPPSFAYHDPHAPSRTELAPSFTGELEGWGLKVTGNTRHRLVAPSWYPVCTLGYAVTNRGAQKLLYNLGGYRGIGSPVDLAIIDLIQNNVIKAYTIIPPLFTTYRTRTTKDSDIDEDTYTRESAENIPVGSENLRSSARKALSWMGEQLG